MKDTTVGQEADMATKILAEVAHPDTVNVGITAVVEEVWCATPDPGSKGYSVRVRDDQAGLFVGCAVIHPTLERAMAQARKIAEG